MISEWCNTHFQQSAETPLTSDQWKNILENPTHQEEILEGTFQPPTSDPTTKEWFQAMQSELTEEERKIDLQINQKVFQDFYKRAREN